ncbi:uncharacterized protein YeeX (DUF496 family) [Azospirillum agricola]|uniref:hypothetical protein n=1 Tax=Azospirillum agricola TaxID=1720247 RepID=UPI001AE9482B|nr:hypothetical protein [Azospirillum agricola]MBP2233290.1 uncharacterized protein YeeX (DUF496 family) [Azospirillum agricola]
MARENLVRPSRDGDQFHYHWAARQCLGLLPSASDLVAVTVEGASSRETGDGRIEDGEDFIDVGLYFGSESLDEARLVRYVQLKHSTRRADQAWTASGLQKTVEGFAKRYAELLKRFASDDVAQRFRFVFTTNRPIEVKLKEATADLTAGAAARHPDLSDKLVKFTTLSEVEAAQFFNLFSLEGSEGDLWAQRNLLSRDLNSYLPGADYDAPLQLKDLATRKATTEFLSNPSIRRHDVLLALKATEELLQPAPCRIPPASDTPLTREQESKVREAILTAAGPIVIHADDSIGKSMLGARLAASMPDGSEAVLYDCYGNGHYRNSLNFRHRHRDALVQMANEIATRGLCHLLIPSAHADAKQYMHAFLHRLKQAIGILRANKAGAVLCLIVDSADNAEMAAEEQREAASFVRDLIRSPLPDGVRLALTCRSDRRGLLEAPPNALEIDLRSSTEKFATPVSLGTAAPLKHVTTTRPDLIVQFGLDGTPVTFQADIGRFVAAYLGKIGEPEPFGGRQRELVVLNDWLADPDATRNLLIWAPAGRGKTALLVHWLNQVAHQHWHKVFVPISVRFSTSGESVFHEALATRLAALLGERLSPPVGDAATHYRDWSLQLLLRVSELDRPVLLVIDGLDEATGWSVSGERLLPAPPPPNVRIVASARLQVDDVDAEGWRRRLRWKGGTALDIEVRSLNIDGVREALESMGAPLDRLPEPDRIVLELHRLTEGDPLLLGYYVKDMWGLGNTAARLRPEELASREKGFGPYFKDWLEEQKPGWLAMDAQLPVLIDTILLVLAGALGPLPHANLAELVRRLENERAVVTARSLQPLARFIMGDQDSGYALSHPRMAQHLRRDHFRDPVLIARADRAFIDWGLEIVAAVNGGCCTPESVSRYLSRHLSEHLMAGKAAPEEFMMLVEDGWRRAWLAYEGGEGGFARDVQRAYAVLVAGPGQARYAWGWRIRCQLVQSSILSVGRNVPPKLLTRGVGEGLISAIQALHTLQFWRSNLQAKALAELAPRLPEGLLAEALDAARGVGDDAARAAVLVELARLLPEQGRAPVLAEALDAAWGIGDDAARAAVQGELARLLPEQGRAPVLAKALDAARRIAADQPRAEALAGLAQQLPEILLAKALDAARAIHNDRARAQALAGLARHLPEALLAEALDTARAIRDNWVRAGALAGLVPHLPKGGQAPVLAEALDAARGVGHNWMRAEALAGLAPLLPEGGRATVLAEALDAACGIGHDWTRVKALTALAPHLSEALLAEALTVARAIRDDRVRAEALVGLAPLLAEGGQAPVLAEALAGARAIRDDRVRAEALAGLASLLAEGGRAPVLAEALDAARAIRDDRVRAEALAGLAPLLAEGGRAPVLAEALDAARAIRDDRVRAEALAGLAPHLSETLLAEALAVARAIRDDRVRVEALAGLAPRLPEALLAEALAAARGIRDDRVRAEALAELAPHLPKALLAVALAAVRAVCDDRVRVEALAGLARLLPEGGRAPVLAEALDAARAIRDDRVRAKTLVGLAQLLPEGGQASVLAEALAAAQAIRDDRVRAKALAGLVPYLPDELLDKALDAARGISDNQVRVELLTGLAQLLPEGGQTPVLVEALEAARAIRDDRVRAEALAGLAPHLPEALLAEVLEAARDIRDNQVRVELLTGLARLLPEGGQAPVLAEALEAARDIRDNQVRVESLAGLAPLLAEGRRVPVLAEALEAARAIRDHEARAEAMKELAPRLPEALLVEALDVARAIRDDEALARLALLLPEEGRVAMLAEALEAVQGIRDDGTRAEALAGLGSHLAEALVTEALDAARAIRNDRVRAEALAGLARLLSEGGQVPVLVEALEAARAIRDHEARAEVLAGLARLLSEGGRVPVLTEALDAARAIRNDRVRAEALAGLVRLLPEGGQAPVLAEALNAARAIRDNRVRGEWLLGLGLLLPVEGRAPVLAEALDAAQAIRDHEARAEALAELAPHLPEALLAEALASLVQDIGRNLRNQAFKSLIPLFAHFKALEGHECLREIHRSITDVVAWYP